MSDEKKTQDEAVEEKTVEVPEKFKALVEQIEQMSVIDLADLVKILEDKFGVSAAAPVAVAAAPAGGEAAAEEQTEFDVELVAAGDSKINVIKAVREITGQGLKEAKDMVDGVPTVIKEKLAKDEAEAMKTTLEDAGATVNLK